MAIAVSYTLATGSIVLNTRLRNNFFGVSSQDKKFIIMFSLLLFSFKVYRSSIDIFIFLITFNSPESCSMHVHTVNAQLLHYF